MNSTAVSSGRDPYDITLIVISKTRAADIVNMAIDCGVRHFGENKIQEAVPKINDLNKRHSDLTWHMVGHLQTNKAKIAVMNFDMIQSVDSIKLARKISGVAQQLQKNVDILIEVNISGEESKYGINPDDVEQINGEIASLSNINVRGLMTIGPLTSDVADIRTAFRRMRKIFENPQIRQNNVYNVLSMGMTDDYEIAIQEGSTMIRLGRAIFGLRN
ncbi:MAG: YggS family pyridoxal phosphate-dependent enzyme [Candidatus Marinimicrobia bacterium]|nr:YggS family pyridoxal phosphate-dependent enzyme [bacterium]MCG2714713.1 YggS family pyridoxal phosphate-dependent enzyme [Candidatus Neomarinimicrobiota bacterium]